MKKSSRFVLALMVLILVVSAFTGCQSAQDIPEQTDNVAADEDTSTQDGTQQEVELQPIKVGYLKFLSFGPIGLAETKGWFEEAGLDVELVVFDSGPPLLEAMIAGEIDMGALGGVPTLRTAGDELFDIRIISTVADVSGFAKIISSSDINSIEELAGKKVSAPWGTTNHYVLESALAQYGMTIEDVDYIDMEALDAQAAFVSGALDACVPAPAAVNSIVNSRDDAHVLFASADLVVPISVFDLWAAPQSVLDTKLLEVQKVLEVFHGRAIPYVTSEETAGQAALELQSWVNEVVGADMTAEEVQTQISSLAFYNIDEMKDIAGTGAFQSMLHGQVEFLINVGLLQTAPNFSKVLNVSAINGIQE